MTTGSDGMREERRIVTALFADIVGSTTIAEHLDPEDAREVLGGAVALVIDQVDALGGTIKDLAGDGVLALFGAPIAHEDDAERAVLCGLRIAEAIEDHARDVAEQLGVEGFSVRVGIETGRAVLGPVGGGSRVEYGATGDVLNTAARLQSRAEPGTVLVGAATRAMIEDRFTWGETGTFELKGKEQPVEAACALAYGPRRHRGAGIVEVPLVGRSEEMVRIASAVEGLPAGRGSVVVLVGEAGVGKSRLVEEARRLTAQLGDGAWLEGGAASYAAAIPYLPYRNLLLVWLGLPLNARRDEVRSAVDARAKALSDAGSEALRALVPTLTGAGDAGSDAEAAQERVFAAVKDLLGALASEERLTLVLEDLHWSDPTSLALTESVVTLTRERPLLVLLTTRPDPDALASLDSLEDAARDAVVVIELPPLSRDGDRELLHALTGDAVLPRTLEERILDTTDGNPFFVREQVRTLIAAGALERSDGSWRFVGASDFALAPTVERALIARIDRLPDTERGTLLAASVLGPRFEEPLVVALTAANSRDALRTLEREEFIVEIANGHDLPSFRFQHALVQEAAYGSLLRRQRRQLHARAASALESTYSGREDEIAATLGRHLAEAGEADRAVGYLLTAARGAAAAFANEEAAALARDALALLGRSPAELTDHDRGRAIELSRIEGTALSVLARHQESADAFRRALAFLRGDRPIEEARIRSEIGGVLCDAHRYEDALAELDAAEERIESRVDDDEAFAVWLDVQHSRATVFYWLADHESYSELLGRLEPLIDERATPEQRIAFYNDVRAALWRRDRYAISDELLRLDQMLYEAVRESASEEDRAWAAFMHGLTLMWHRDLDEAEPLFRESLAEADRLGSTLLRSRALTYLMVTARLRGDVEAASRFVDPVRESAREADLPEYEAMALATAAWAAYHHGDTAAVLEDGPRAIEVWAGLPNRYPFDWMSCFPLLGATLTLGDVDGARRWAEAMLAEPQQRLPDRLAAPLRTGIDAAAAGDAAAATAAFEGALARAIQLHYL